MRLLRNLSRRKLRTGLTIAGITIGMWALVVFSSMANKINSLVEGGGDYYKDKIVVTDTSAGSMGAAAPMSAAMADQLRSVPGVGVAVPQVQLPFDAEGGGGMGTVEMIVASPPIVGGPDSADLRYADGRGLEAADDDTRTVVLGSDLARKYAKRPGDSIDIRGASFTVVGVLEPTLTAPDTTAMIPLAAGQAFLANELPAVVRDTLATEDLASQVVVYPAAGADLSVVAADIKAAFPDAQTMTAADFEDQVGSSVAIFNAIIIGVALISLVVGGLSVINTMAMSVQERTREIGIKRAIGGARGRVVRELVSEAAVIGLIGGLLGLALGAVVVVLANEAGRGSGTVLFDLTPGTAMFAVAFSTILGMVAGVVPAWSAARLDPVQALRHD